MLFSVVIPAFNEEKYIDACIDALLDQTIQDSEYEIIIVNNDSNDRTEEIAKSRNVNVIMSRATTVGGVRNHGAKHAKGKFLAFSDADCLIPKDWLENAKEAIRNFSPTRAIGGPCKIPKNSTWVQKCWVLTSENEMQVNRNLAGSRLIIARELFDEIGGFNEEINAGEDTDLSARLVSSGHGTLNLPQLAVTHLAYPSQLIELARQQFWHASSYLKTNNGIHDKVFILTIAFLTGLAILPICLFYDSLYPISILLISAPPLMFTLKKYRSSKESPISLKFFGVVIVSFSYFIGRSAGLIFSLTGKNRKSW